MTRGLLCALCGCHSAYHHGEGCSLCEQCPGYDNSQLAGPVGPRGVECNISGPA